MEVTQLAGSLSGFASVSSWLATNEAIVANGAYGFVLLLVLLFERDGIFGLLRRLGVAGLRLARWRGRARQPGGQA